MRELVTTLLGALAVLVIAAGVGLALFEWAGWWSAVVSGALVLAAAELSDMRDRPKSGDS